VHACFAVSLPSDEKSGQLSAMTDAVGQLLLTKTLMEYVRARGRARKRALEMASIVSQSKAARRRKLAWLRSIAEMINANQESAEKKAPRQRRVVLRAKDSWKGSTMFGYTMVPEENDDKTYLDNFRMNKDTFASVARDIEKSGARFVPRPGCVKKPRVTPPVRFKLGTCLYVLALGCCVKAAADVASVGKTTVDLWLAQFQEVAMSHLKPKYMPGTPPSEAGLEHVRSEFAARRGVPNVALACDGSHVPFGTHHGDYRNYKGWYSILVLGFVNSFHLFVDGDVGYPGKAGDNTVLRHSWLLSQITADPDAWLGRDGVILGDSGASDHDGVFMNPYPNPKTPEEFYLNFCHSSTRFYVEEVFGRWKNRFRFLLHTHDMQHKIFCQLVYTTMILHNICTMHKGNDIKFDIGSDEEWQEYFKKFARDSCPSCTRANIAHCVHNTRNRERNTGHSISGTPSSQRDQLRDALWKSLCDGEFDLDNLSEREAAQVRRVHEEMDRRAREGIRAERACDCS
jgi:hypothetical protein